jgi:hypothetical protein
MICLADRGNSMGLKKIEVHIDALREVIRKVFLSIFVLYLERHGKKQNVFLR